MCACVCTRMRGRLLCWADVMACKQTMTEVCIEWSLDPGWAGGGGCEAVRDCLTLAVVGPGWLVMFVSYMIY